MAILNCPAQSYIYITRHAEKATNDPKDPELTSDGIARANALGILLYTKNIKKIYSTSYKRTQSTAKPLSEAIHVPIQEYNKDTSGTLLRRVLASRQNTFIVGHSNSVIPMLDSLGLPHKKMKIEENEYDNLFIVTMKKGHAISVKETKFGAPSPVN